MVNLISQITSTLNKPSKRRFYSFYKLSKKGVKNTLLTLLLIVTAPVFAKTITVETERQTVEYGDIVTLNITADFQVITGQLDLTPLEAQFELLGTQRSNNIQLVNGDFQSSTSWLVQLLPKQEGELTIPPFEFEGIQSEPYTLTVKPLQVQHNGPALKPFFLESTVDEINPYIQQQVIYTLRFYHQGRYVDGMLRPPKFDKVMLEPLKEQAVYQKQIQGKNYTVYEWLYALFPQSSGEINIEPPLFNGRIQYAGQLRQVKEFAKAINLNVKAEPASYRERVASSGQNSWLPTQSLTLNESWKQPNTDEIQVGDTLTQTVSMSVAGLKINQLPNLTLPAQIEYKVYPDKPVDSEQASATGIRSVKTFNRSIIPTQPGTLTLPEQVVYWWNTNTNQLDKTVLPSKTLNVKAAVSAQQNQADCTLPSQDLTATPTGQSTGLQEGVSNVWVGLSLLFGLLAIAASVLFIRERAHVTALKNHIKAALTESEKQKEQAQQAWQDIDELCKLPPAELYPALKTWLKTRHKIQHFSELNQPHLQRLIQQLEAALYNRSTLDSSLPEQLAEALKQFELSRQTKRAKPAGLLGSKPAKNPTESKLASLYKR